MQRLGLLWICTALLALTSGGCATVVSGTSQSISVNSEPSEADCTLTRAGVPLGAVKTPGLLTVKRDAKTIHVVCKKAGHEDGTVIMNSRFESTTMGNLVVGGLVGIMVDAASGANSRYDNFVMVPLAPAVGGQPAVAAASVPGAAAPAPATGAYDGDYHGGMELRASGVNSLRRIAVRVVGGQGTGTAQYALCQEPGEARLTIDASGAISGEFDLQSGSFCRPFKIPVTGRAEAGRLMLQLPYRDRTIEFTLSRDGTPG